MVSNRRNGGHWRYVFAAVGWLILAGAAEDHHGPKQAQQAQPRTEVAQPAPAPIPAPQAKPDQSPSKRCEGTDQPDLPCEAVAAQAAIDQARDAHRQILIGWAQAIGLVFSLFFSALATWAAFKAVGEAEKGAQASKDALDETRNMNAATVRPHIAIESAVIQFRADDLCPEITLTTRNTGDFTAHDWEWQPLLKYGAHGSPSQRKTPVHRWGQRGVAGVDLPRGDQSPRIPVRLGGFELNLAESAAATALTIAEGLHVHLTVFSRCYDTFGNSVDDTHHFTRVVFNLMEWLEPGWANLPLQRTPPGTRIEGDEDRIPT